MTLPTKTAESHTDVETYFRIGRTYFLSADYARARSFFMEVARTGSALGHLYLGHVASAEGDVAGALRYYDAALRLDPECDTAHECSATLLLHHGRPRQALEPFRAALEAGRNSLELHCNYVSALLQCGDLGEARSAWLEAQDVHPGRPELVELSCRLT